jgi:hypothetical protein
VTHLRVARGAARPVFALQNGRVRRPLLMGRPTTANAHVNAELASNCGRDVKIVSTIRAKRGLAQ